MTAGIAREVVAKAIHDGRGICHTEDDRMFEPVTWEEVAAEDYPVEAEYARNLADAAIAAHAPYVAAEVAHAVAAERDAIAQWIRQQGGMEWCASQIEHGDHLA